MNKRHPYRDMEREYVTTDISIRELCRRHGITAHSLLTVQAQKGAYQAKRRAYQAKASDAYIQHHADRMAAREAEVRFHALEAIDEAIIKFRADMKRTERKLICGEWVEVPVMLITPKDVALLIDKSQVLFDRPSTISEGRGIKITSEAIPVDALQATRELMTPTSDRTSGLPDHRERRPD